MGKQTARKGVRSATRRKSGRTRTRFAKSARMVLLGAALIGCFILMGFFISKVARPYLISYGELKEIAEIKAQIAEVSAENRALKDEIAYLSTPEGKIAEARKLGWVKEGEVALVIQQPDGLLDENGQALDFMEHEPLWHAAGRKVIGLFVRLEPPR